MSAVRPGRRTAFNVHLDAGSRVSVPTGQFQDWTWHHGSTRVTWHQEQTQVVYKIEISAGRHANEDEHRNARVLKEQGKCWAPATDLYAIEYAPGGFVLAMPYYPTPVVHRDEIPADALQILPDQFLSNFRRTAPSPGGEIK